MVLNCGKGFSQILNGNVQFCLPRMEYIPGTTLRERVEKKVTNSNK